MKRKISDLKQLSIIGVIFAVTATVMFSFAPAAMAMPGFTYGCVEGTIVAGSDCTIVGTANIVSRTDELHVVDQEAEISPSGTFSGNVCTSNEVVGGGVSQWELRDDTGTDEIRFYAPNAFDTISVPFKDGIVTISTTGTAVTTDDGSDPATSGTSSDKDAKWVDITNAATPATDTRDPPTKYRIIACGAEGSQLDTNYNDEDFFETTAPVAGEILPINTVALLIAGVSTSVMWLVPLAVVAGGTFALLRYQVNNKE